MKRNPHSTQIGNKTYVRKPGGCFTGPAFKEFHAEPAGEHRFTIWGTGPGDHDLDNKCWGTYLEALKAWRDAGSPAAPHASGIDRVTIQHHIYEAGTVRAAESTDIFAPERN